MAVLCRPEMVQLTLPPALVVTALGLSVWTLSKGVPCALGKRSRGGELIHWPKLTVALSRGLSAQALRPGRPIPRAATRRRACRRERFMAWLLRGGGRARVRATVTTADRRVAGQ